MIASDKVIEKISIKCTDDKNLKDFLISLFDFETQENGWWTDHYEKLIEKHISEESNDENS